MEFGKDPLPFDSQHFNGIYLNFPTTTVVEEIGLIYLKYYIAKD